MIYMFLADGFEEIEAIATLDVIRRAELTVKTVGIGSKTVTGAHGITVTADLSEDQCFLSSELSTIILPGGMPGTLGLEKSQTVQSAISFAVQKEIIIAAICAAPSILGHIGLLEGIKATAFPGFEQELGGAVYVDQPVVKDGNIITAKGAGVAIDFGLAIVECFCGEDEAKRLRAAMQCVR